MNRRHFLSALATAASAMALDLERLLWVPGQKTIFIPPAPNPCQPLAYVAEGDVITFAGVYALNPITGKRTKYLQHFQVIGGSAETRIMMPLIKVYRGP